MEIYTKILLLLIINALVSNAFILLIVYKIKKSGVDVITTASNQIKSNLETVRIIMGKDKK